MQSNKSTITTPLRTERNLRGYLSQSLIWRAQERLRVTPTFEFGKSSASPFSMCTWSPVAPRLWMDMKEGQRLICVAIWEVIVGTEWQLRVQLYRFITNSVLCSLFSVSETIDCLLVVWHQESYFNNLHPADLLKRFWSSKKERGPR